jgi:predicted phosphodiesterase
MHSGAEAPNPSAPTIFFSMKYIILSDIHSNLQAFEAVIRSFSKKGYDKIICAGDTVGYGADPDACIEKISSLTDVNILGNHDAAVIDKTDASNFNTYARAAVEWTREHLSSEGHAYLNGLPLVHDRDDLTAVHGTLHDPEEFIYMMTDRDAMHTFEIMRRKVCFVGHSHVPGVFVLRKEELVYSEAGKIELEENAKYIVNVGSVGQPRDGDPRACYCVFDAEKGRIEFFRIGYDIPTAQKRILTAGIPAALAERLEYGR